MSLVLHACVVHDHVEAADLVFDGVGRSADRIGIAHVDEEQGDGSVGFEVGHCATAPTLITRADQNCRAGAREPTSDLETDALVRAGDQRNALIGPRGEGQLNDWPQPQVRCALGLSIAKPASLRPSL